MVAARQIRLQRFRPANMKTNRVCVMVGKKGSGKSTLVNDIMWFQQNIPMGMIMSATEEANEAYSEMAPPLFIYKDFDADALLRIINRQKKMKAMLKQNNDELPFDHRAFLLMDDCMYNKKNFRSELIRELFMNGRHWDLFVLITMQYVMDMTTEIRSNTDYVFACKENIKKNRERLYNEFFGVFPDFATFDALFLEVTQDWRCLVLDNTVPSTDISECVFWYKAEPRSHFRLGADWYWEFSRRNARKEGTSQVDTAELQKMKDRAVEVVMEGQRRPRPNPPRPDKVAYETAGPSQVRYGRPPPPRPHQFDQTRHPMAHQSYQSYQQPTVPPPPRDYQAYQYREERARPEPEESVQRAAYSHVSGNPFTATLAGPVQHQHYYDYARYTRPGGEYFGGFVS